MNIPHSSLMGGSTAARRIMCPGSYKLEAEFPEPPESEFAAEGSMLHAAMELMLTANPKTDEYNGVAAEFIGQDLGFEGHEITPDHLDEKILPAYEAWLELIHQYDIEDYFIEAQLGMPGIIDGAFGTVDVLAKDKYGCLHVLDWKFGDGVKVEAETNMQLAFYTACALYDDDAEIQEFTADVTDIYFHIVQPRRGHDEPVASSWKTNVEHIEDFIDLAKKAAELATSEDAPLRTGDHCRFCRAISGCPRHKEAAITALDMEPKGLSATDYAKALELATLLKPWIKSVFENAQLEAEGGVQIPGFKLVKKRATRRWIDEEETAKALKRARVRVADSYKKVLLSPAQMEKSVPEVYGKTLHTLVESRSSGLTLVPETDKRPAVEDAFALLTEAQQATGT